MSAALHLLSAHAGLSIQDEGRRGARALGLASGGAIDRLALLEAAALLGQAPGAALEMAGAGGRFRAEGALRIALTGAPMAARIDGAPVYWPGAHRLEDGQLLEIGTATRGVFGYLSFGGGIATPEWLGSHATSPAQGIGAALATGDRLPAGPDPGGAVGVTLDPADRFGGGVVRVLTGPQSALFDDATRVRFAAIAFRRDTRGNRQGIRLAHDGEGFAAANQRVLVSDVVLPGDIQITGDGTPYVLMPDCQTTGGYPRIGTVVPDDLAIVAQAPPGSVLQIRVVDRAEALADWRARRRAETALPRALRPIRRDPAQMHDLLSHQLVDGVTDGRAPRERAGP